MQRRKAVAEGRVVVLPVSGQTDVAPAATEATVPAPIKMSGRPYEHRKNPSGTPATLQNTILAIHKLGIECRYDIFHDKLTVEGHELKINVGESIDDICLRIRTAIIQHEQFDPGNQNTFDAVRRTCLANQFDPVVDYLDGLKHDGKPRIDTWLTVYLGAEDNPLNRAIGRKMLIGAVRRAHEPGCKFDYIVVLEGAQGSGKSTALRILAGDANFSDADILPADPREQQELIVGVWIYELSELAGLRKTEVEKVKMFASKTCDSARPAYARSRVDRPRRCILVGTTNDAEYLQDATGNRRFWPVPTGTIDLDALRRDRDQLWAEAAAATEELTIPRELWGEAEERQNSRLVGDPWDDRLEGLERLAPSGGSIVKIGGEWRVSRDYILTSILNFDPKIDPQLGCPPVSSVHASPWLAWTYTAHGQW
jgi:putative DNA primase/helicase